MNPSLLRTVNPLLRPVAEVIGGTEFLIRTAAQDIYIDVVLEDFPEMEAADEEEADEEEEG